MGQELEIITPGIPTSRQYHVPCISHMSGMSTHFQQSVDDGKSAEQSEKGG